MSIETSAIQQHMLQTFSDLASVADDPAIAANPASAAGNADFATTFTSVIDNVNQLQNEAANKMTAVETGLSDDLVGTMIATQKASLSFSTAVQVRNKLLSGFDDIMTMSL